MNKILILGYSSICIRRVIPALNKMKEIWFVDAMKCTEFQDRAEIETKIPYLEKILLILKKYYLFINLFL